MARIGPLRADCSRWRANHAGGDAERIRALSAGDFNSITGTSQPRPV
ncbi:MAG TPA: hypothetical protein VHV74_06060 [Pseudonocardiaceae bacterium]|nr:hypothetical protein [Pseudonocardiaceae bacterium]